MAGHDDVVTGIYFLYIFGNKTTAERALELIEIKFSKAITVDAILEDTEWSANYRMSTKKLMGFDAKINKLNTGVANALYSAANMQDQSLKLFYEVEDYQDNLRTFVLFIYLCRNVQDPNDGGRR